MLSVKQRAREVAQKLKSLRTSMAQKNLDVVLLTKSPNIAWLTAGASTDIVLTSDRSSISIAVTPDQATILTDTIEARRLFDEEQLTELGLTIDAGPWWGTAASLTAMLDGRRSGGDDGQSGIDMSEYLQSMRTTLYATEIERLRQAARCCAQAMPATTASIMPGMTEMRSPRNWPSIRSGKGGR